MRKCIYTYYQKPEETASGKSGWSGEKTGVFHSWGFESVGGDDGSIAMDSVGIIEDVETGKVRTTIPSRIQFINNP